MTKKPLLLIASLPLTIAVTLGVLAMLPPRPGVTKANFDRIEKGMTLAEVEAILGKNHSAYFVSMKLTIRPRFGTRIWSNPDESRAQIFFPSEDSVYTKRWTDSSETTVEKICRWLRLR